MLTNGTVESKIVNKLLSDKYGGWELFFGRQVLEDLVVRIVSEITGGGLISAKEAAYLHDRMFSEDARFSLHEECLDANTHVCPCYA